MRAEPQLCACNGSEPEVQECRRQAACSAAKDKPPLMLLRVQNGLPEGMRLVTVAGGFATLASCEGAYSVVLTLMKHTPAPAQPPAAAQEAADQPQVLPVRRGWPQHLATIIDVPAGRGHTAWR